MSVVIETRKSPLFRYLMMGVVVIAGLSGAAMIGLFLFLSSGWRVGLALGLGWLGLIGLLVSCTVLLQRRIIRPIAAVNQAAAAIAQGEYSTRIPLPKTRSELHELSVEMNNMAEKIAFAERTKHEFISTISHELRTPLTAIKGWGETLLHSDLPDDNLLRRGLSVIIDESVRLDNLVEQLLDFSRMQSNRIVLKMEPVDFLAELDEVVYFFCEQRAAQGGIALQSNTPDVPAPGLGDPARIRQIFINLLDNAFKHTPQGGTITVTADFTPQLPKERPTTTSPEFVHIIISDTGCGVSEQDLPHLTEKFFKAETGTPGSGIGLAVVEELLKAHEGLLEFESVPGQGLSVYITFPLKSRNTQG